MTTFILQTHPENIRAHPRIKPKIYDRMHSPDSSREHSDSSDSSKHSEIKNTSEKSSLRN
uniref:Uncharacterized protein n=1 Tax=Rhizophagus irregularis (strain DAOM 181602 / DAOM 197198 / MUCL 43194) TaxID=747089 RepID=U9UIR4_RHIID